MAAQSYQEEITALDSELAKVDSELKGLRERRRRLMEKRDQALRILQNRAIVSEESQNAWEKGEFPWTAKVTDLLHSKFNMSSFRPLQLSAINAVLSKEDVILIMSTGGGKSLCYQIPALIRPPPALAVPGASSSATASTSTSKSAQTGGMITLVISPLISLMEDQLMALDRFGISAAKLTADSTKEQINWIQDQMTNPDAKAVELQVCLGLLGTS